jgi:hypothetical protein
VADGGLDGVDGGRPDAPLVVAVDGDLLGELGGAGVLGVGGGGVDLVAGDPLGGGGDLLLDDRPDVVVAVADPVRRLAAAARVGGERHGLQVALVVEVAEAVAAFHADAQPALVRRSS